MVPKKFTECDKIKPVQFKTAVVALFREMIHKRQQKEKKKKTNTRYRHIVFRNRLKTYRIILIISSIFWAMMKHVNWQPTDVESVYSMIFFCLFKKLFIVLFVPRALKRN